MLFGLVLVVHILVAVFLIAVILLQGGRGGLGEALGGAAAQSLFGGGANVVMSRVTAVGAAMFMVTCLSLAALSTAQGQSVIDRMPVPPADLPAALPGVAVPETPAPVPSAPSGEPAPAGESSESSPTDDATSP